ncbi:polysaccharide deacetylase family protein [Gloeocapsopsis crepidinum LEGE 06123]|uniref:Polysaccharide deacetylase family protein n=1 Tax=Gloeocapsopsis crepidinum LEGE 06123 TaxID=588587 RepID=A0ABR9UY58_9CHRO|nr:polysaccharide deacetylase family protein [Gloeocapsopsis crepidinum]MBE9193222.1 polysaccharide deacetylase family protein [Gloeocapsopsis crepidinum LEGE 06123]
MKLYQRILHVALCCGFSQICALSIPIPVAGLPSLVSPCHENSSAISYTNLVHPAIHLASWIHEPQILLSKLVQDLGPLLVASLNSSSTPNLHTRAKQARVPVMMYHDILPQKEVFFDVTPQELASHLELIRVQKLTPISLAQLVTHLRTGIPLPEKPILLTFDDGYGGHYQYVYPLLKKYGYPATFSIYTSNLGKNTGRTHVNWEQLRQMAADPLVTIAAHTVTHPTDLRTLPQDQLQFEITESKRILETQLGISVDYFVYPAGKYDVQVANFVEQAGYKAALTMDDAVDRFAGESENLFAIARIGQSRLTNAIAAAWGGPQLPAWGVKFDFNSVIAINTTTLNQARLILITGGQPTTIHAKSRYQVPQILADTPAVAAVDGGFFSLKSLDSNVMIGPVLSHNSKFVPGNNSENRKLNGRPLVAINSQVVKFVPFNSQQHNTLAGLNTALPRVTDAFVAAAWLVKDSQPQPASTFGSLFDFDAARHRAFWGINQAGQPAIGVSTTLIDSVSLGLALAHAGLRDAVMLDSGASTSLAYKGESLVGYRPRPVPHVVALVPPQIMTQNHCRVKSG